jgi:hypothetical protein
MSQPNVHPKLKPPPGIDCIKSIELISADHLDQKNGAERFIGGKRARSNPFFLTGVMERRIAIVVHAE